MNCACNYLYLTDNLLDPSHVAWVHVTSFAAKGTEDTPLQITTKEDGVIVWRWMKDRELPPYYAPLVKFQGNCDRLQHYEVRYPSIGVNKSVYTRAGLGGDVDNLPPDAYVMVSYHFMTPIDETHTQYIWMQQRNTDPHDARSASRSPPAPRWPSRKTASCWRPCRWGWIPRPLRISTLRSTPAPCASGAARRHDRAGERRPAGRGVGFVSATSRTGFRRYRVVGKTAESSVITSFEIVPSDGGDLSPFEPGQFLSFRLDPSDEGAPLRHYSLSGDPRRRGSYRFSVKREAAPAERPDLPPGRMSSRLHDEVRVGDELLARGPEGQFALDRSSSRPVVLLSGGVGATPLVSMAHALCAEGRRKTWFIHACDGSAVHAFGAEMRQLEAQSDNLVVHVLYRSARPGDIAGRSLQRGGIAEPRSAAAPPAPRRLRVLPLRPHALHAGRLRPAA